MKDFHNIPNLYFLGIGGIGMSALARYAKAMGKTVGGYDLTPTPLTRELEQEGMAVHYHEEINQFSSIFLKENTLVVLTPAVPASNAEFSYLKANGYQIVKRSELLGFLTKGKVCIAVAGTHGKTSVSTMITLLIKESGMDVGAFLGGISRNFNSNLVLPKSPESPVVTEADEFDRSFLQLEPDIAVITSVDADHLDIYGTHSQVLDAFGLFAAKIKPGGTLLYKKGIDLQACLGADVKAYSYGIETEADFIAQNVRIEQGAFHFDMKTPWETIPNIRMEYPGRVNLENMLAAAAVACLSGIGAEAIRKAVPLYKGVVRRFDIRFKNNELLYIDDYAHHPSELEATIKSVKELYAGQKVLGIFQPHLFSRTSDFYREFASSLDLLDEAILLDIYPARELPLPGITSELILQNMKLEAKALVSMDALLEVLKNRNFDVLLTMGAGNIDQMVEPITNFLKQKYLNNEP
ncbi:MAG: UDP-N-acetylmuramate--L-alanine ligase [Prolixibacteraceae bacterium]|nr:UDP-N-acetylmuramate--L-alanine ligase [Prolixibacteraceae bacterium]